MREEHEQRLITLVRTREQPWLGAIAGCVAAQDIARLDALTSLANPDYAVLAAGARDDGIEDEFSEFIETPVGRAARGVTALARSVLEPRERAGLVARALDAFAANGVVSAVSAPGAEKAAEPGAEPGAESGAEKAAEPVFGAVRDQEQKRSRTGDLADPLLGVLRGSDAPAAGFAELLVRLLTGRFPEPVGSPAQVSVLLRTYNSSTGTGLGALLRLERLRGGPPGLHADPRTMAFIQCDQDFADALDEAWRTSRLAETGACVVWGLYDEEETLDHVKGGSLGAAFAVGLDDLSPRTRMGRVLRRRTLNPACAVTGRVEGRQILPVQGYEGKLRAAADKHWRVVVPEESREEINEIRFRLSGSPDVVFARTVPQAIRAVRSRANKKLMITVLVVILVLAGVGGGAAVVNTVRQRQIRAQELRTSAAELATRAHEELDSDPRLAALMALAGYKMNPSMNSVRALREVSEEYPAVVGTVDAHDAQVTRVTNVGDFTISGDAHGTVSLWSKELKLGSLELEGEVRGLTGSLDGTLAVAVVDNEMVFIGVSDEGELTERRRVPARADHPNIVVAPDGSQVRVIGQAGKMGLYSPYGYPEGDADPPKLADKSGEEVRVTAAAIYMGGHIPGETCHDDCLLLGTDKGGVYLYDVKAGSARLIVSDRGSVTALACDDTVITVGTDRGVQVWDQETSAATELALPGSDSVVHDVVMTWRGQIAVLIGGALTATTVLYYDIDQRGPATQTIAGTAVGAADNAYGVVVGTSDGRLVTLNRQENRTAAVRTPATTALASTPDGEFVQVFDKGLRVLSLDDSAPGGYTIAQELRIPDEWADDTWTVDDIDVNSDLIAASGLITTRDQDGEKSAGVIAFWDRGSGEVVSTYMDGLPDRGGPWGRDIKRVRFLGDTGLVAAFESLLGRLAVYDTGRQGGLLSERRLGNDVGGLEYSEVNGMVYALVWSDRSAGASDYEHRIVALDAASGMTQWTLPVGQASRISVNRVTGDLAVLEGSAITVYSGQDHSVLRQGELLNPAEDIVWSPDGTRIAAIEGGGRIDVVDAETFDQAVPTILAGNGLDLTDIAWGSDSQSLAASTVPGNAVGIPPDDYTYIVRTDETNWADRMCAIAGSGLSEEEWRTYVKGVLPYEDLCPA
ncbi:hypothetical protein [Actinomyces israelii]|uniref:hypothetical protein n=1 Tax=Actinomyces israelii TaxID=1659 RepID=UPI002356B70D|nr:hypothetical protein [Actinomyces israelii]